MTMKPNHNGAKNGGGHWGRREEAKRLSKKQRRADDVTTVILGVVGDGAVSTEMQVRAMRKCRACKSPITNSRLRLFAPNERDAVELCGECEK